MNKLDVLARISPQMKAVLAKEDELAGDTTDTSVGFEVMRKNYVEGRKYWVQGGPTMVKTFDQNIEGPYGEIPVRFYYPTLSSIEGAKHHATRTPAIIYVHGGGFCLGNLETHDRICRVLASKSNAIVVAVDYRLSPESKFPVQVHEVACVTEYVHEHAAEYGNGRRFRRSSLEPGCNHVFARGKEERSIY